MASRAGVLTMATVIALSGLIAAAPDADARRPRRRRNMPTDWTWPPNKAMRAEGDRCLARLTELGVTYEREKKRRRKVATPIVVPSMEIGGLRLEPAPGEGKGPWIMDCHLALALAEGGAAALRAEGVAAIQFIQLFAYRNVRLRKRTLKVLSRHALGLAIDIGAFVDLTGIAHEVTLRGYRGTPLLRTLDHALARTGLFRGPLTPGNDPRSHYDHFHLEARTGRELDSLARTQARSTPPAVPGPTTPPATPVPRF